MKREIMRCVAGSNLYGTTNLDSDIDYKAVHIPDGRAILLGRAKPVESTSTGDNRSTNTKDDSDFESFTVQRFLSLACKMQTIPVEMLFIPQENLIHNSTTWQTIVANRDRILNRDGNSFVGYCRAQAVRYSARGDRLETFEKVVKFLSELEQKCTIRLLGKDTIEALKNLAPNVNIIDKEQPGGGLVPYLSVYGRQAPLTCTVYDIKAIFAQPIKGAGARAKAARDAGGADWKALYHAVRIAHEGIELFSNGTITFPSEIAPMLRSIRNGEVPMDKVLDLFDELVYRLEELVGKNGFAHEPDRAWCDEFVAQLNYDAVMRT